jgi:hypothetical protein
MKKIRYSAVELLGTLILLFLTAPFFQDLPHGDLIEATLMTLAMVFSVMAVGGRRRTMIIAIALVVPAIAGRWIHHLHHEVLHPAVYPAAALVFFGFVVAHLIRFIVKAPQVDANVLCAGVSGFLMLGLLWIPLYMTVARLNPNAFTVPAGTQFDGFSAFYFSFVTLCTVGYGDITPVSGMARMLAIIEAIAGLFYMAVLISRLVSLYSSRRTPAE